MSSIPATSTHFLGLAKTQWRWWITVLLIVLFLLVPVYAHFSGDHYSLILFGRVLVFAMAAVGLNFALGFGGMVSLGHAMYIGIGAYSVALLSYYGYDNGFLHLAVLSLSTLVIALPIGFIALRTQGIAFIMITLAFAQMLFFVFIGLKMYGGDEGLAIAKVSNFGPLTANKTALYLSLMLALGISLYVFKRLIASQFGLVLRATKINEKRVKAIGTAPLGYRLLAYVLSAELCAIAGYFLANLTAFASPAYMAWAVSGELIVMVLLGGVGTLIGPVIGAAAFLILEELLKGMTEHWMVIMGPIIVLIVLFLRNGLWGILSDTPNQGQGGGR